MTGHRGEILRYHSLSFTLGFTIKQMFDDDSDRDITIMLFN